MSDFDTVTRGTLVGENGIVEGGFAAVRDGKIAMPGSNNVAAGRAMHDFGDATVLAGGIGSQVHARSRADQADFTGSTRSAAAGGVTTIVDMPYDAGLLILTGEMISTKARSDGAQARVDFDLHGTIRPSQVPSHGAAKAAAGAATCKFAMFDSDPDRLPGIPAPLLYAAFAAGAKFGLIAGTDGTGA